MNKFQRSLPVAARTIPNGLIIKNSLIAGAGLGVFTDDKSLKPGIIFGPYAGVKVYSEQEARQSGYCWQVAEMRGFLVFTNLVGTVIKQVEMTNIQTIRQ